MTDLTGLTLAEAADLIRQRKLSPVELTDACLARIDALQGTLNAFITVMGEDVRAEARAAEEEIAAGNYRGPLHGIPIGLKDIFDVAGVRTTAGSKIWEQHIAADDSAVTRRLREAGAVIVGKLNMHEWAFGATGASSHFGPARNPWDTERITGGSSSGSGAAVAAGMCFAAMGTDTGGSIRIPASLCGITGIKPTFGRVSRAGLVPLSWSLDHAGPLTRTVRDAALVLQAIAGADPDDPSTVDEPPTDYAAALEGEPALSGVRIGVVDLSSFREAEPVVASGFNEACRVLGDLGAGLESVTIPYMEQIPGAVAAIMLPEALAFHQKRLAEHGDDYQPDVRYRLELAATYPAVTHVQAQRLRELAVRAARDEVFPKYDLLVTPATRTFATPIETADFSRGLDLIQYTNPFNLLGTPAISIPCGFREDGLPLGLQIIGRWWAEAGVFRAAHAYEQATDWHTRRPPL